MGACQGQGHEKPFCLKLPVGTLKASLDAKLVSTLKARLPANWASKSTKELLKIGLDNLRIRGLT